MRQEQLERYLRRARASSLRQDRAKGCVESEDTAARQAEQRAGDYRFTYRSEVKDRVDYGLAARQHPGRARERSAARAYMTRSGRRRDPGVDHVLR